VLHQVPKKALALLTLPELVAGEQQFQFRQDRVAHISIRDYGKSWAGLLFGRRFTRRYTHKKQP
jgi:hypothetical protein